MTNDLSTLPPELRSPSTTEMKEFETWGPLRRHGILSDRVGALADELGSLGYRFDRPEIQNEA